VDERRRRRHLYYAEISDGPKVDQIFFFFLLTLPGIVEAGCEGAGDPTQRLRAGILHTQVIVRCDVRVFVARKRENNSCNRGAQSPRFGMVARDWNHLTLTEYVGISFDEKFEFDINCAALSLIMSGQRLPLTGPSDPSRWGQYLQLSSTNPPEFEFGDGDGNG
jgi:hypothetical protein